MIHHAAVVTAPPVKISLFNAASSIKKKKTVAKERVEKWGNADRDGRTDICVLIRERL